MKKFKRVLLIFLTINCLNFSLCYSKTTEDAERILNTKRNLLVLMISYPEHIKDIEKGDDGLIYLITNDNKKILYDDGKEKNSDTRFHNPDVEDTLYEPYPLEKINGIMEENKNPGRVRAYSFLNAIYGSDRNTIEKNLIYVPTYYGDIMFNKVNNAAENLKNALNEVGKLSAIDNKVNQYVTPLSGTYNYRVIQDTGQLSPHAYGIAIDLKRDDADYWKWGKKKEANDRIANYPKELVEIFEKYGFIWGGKWNHFDILHFEYRPEIILKARLFNNSNEHKEWYGDVELNERNSSYIKTIDNLLN